MTTLADEIERLAAKAFPRALTPTKLLETPRYDFTNLIALNLPTILTALRGAEQVREDAARLVATYGAYEVDGAKVQPSWGLLQAVAWHVRAMPMEDRT